MTPAELFAKVQAYIEEAEDHMQAVVLETLGYRWGKQSVTAGSQTITFSQPYDAGETDYDLRIQVFDADGVDIGGVTSNHVEEGFDIEVPFDGTLRYKATNPDVWID